MTNEDGTWPGTFQVGATAFFGEQSAGTWTLQLIDKNTGTVAQYKDLTVRAWGSEVTSDNHYVLTDAFKGSKTVSDDAGTDLIDAAAVSTVSRSTSMPAKPPRSPVEPSRLPPTRRSKTPLVALARIP